LEHCHQIDTICNLQTTTAVRHLCTIDIEKKLRTTPKGNEKLAKINEKTRENSKTIRRSQAEEWDWAWVAAWVAWALALASVGIHLCVVFA